MASLKKIEISGVRSFGDEEGDAQTIRFHKPLTLILGENGCGKSTIIECLRYVTAYKDPSGKGTFLHDPRLTNKHTVKAKVMLKFSDRKSKAHYICRNAQATVSKAGVSYKSLDGVITKIDEKTKKPLSISSRCIDMSEEIPRLFGVSRAILENVIFCTQEDSFWPLETDQKLKEKFDQIFDSDKYNKAVKKIIDKRKSVKADMTAQNIALGYLKTNRTQALEKKRQLQKVQKQVEDSKAEEESCDSQLKPIEDRLIELRKSELDLSEKFNAAQLKKTELKSMESHQEELKTRIKAGFDGTDFELKEKLDNFRNEMPKKHDEISELKGQVQQCERREGKLSREMMDEQGKLGQLEKQDEMNKKQIADRNARLNILVADLELTGITPSHVSEEDLQSHLTQIQKAIKLKRDELDSFNKKKDEEDQKLQDKVDKAKEEFLNTKHQAGSKEKEITTCKEELISVKNEIDELDKSASKLAKLEAQLSQVNRSVNDLQNSVNADQLKREIKDLTDKRKSEEAHVNDVEKEVQVLQEQAATVTELDMKRENKATKDFEIRRLLNKHEDSIREMLGSMPESGFRSVIQNHVEKLRRQVKELASSHSRKEKELSTLEANRKHLLDQLRTREEMLRSDEEEIYGVCGSDDFEETLQSVSNRLDDLQDVRGTLSSSQYMYNRYVKKLQQQKPCCPLCHRDFSSRDDADSLIEELLGKVQEVPSKLTENKTELDEKESKRNKLLTLRPKYERISVLKNTEIPKMRSDLEKVEGDLKKLRKDLDELSSKILVPQTDEAICFSIQGDMSVLDQLQTDQKKLDAEIRTLQAKLESRGGSKRTLQEALSEQNALRGKLKTVRERIEKLQIQLNDFNEKLQDLQRQKNSLMEDINKIQRGGGTRKQLETRYSELQGREIVLMEELDEIQDKLKPLMKEQQRLESQKAVAKENNSRNLNEMRNKIYKLDKQVEDIESLTQKIAREGGVERKITSAKASIQRIKEEIETMKNDKAKLRGKIEEIEKDLANQEVREQELLDNLRYREKNREIEDLRKKIRELEDKYNNFDIDSIVNEMRKLKSNEETILKKKSQLQGRMIELEHNVQQLQKELNSESYKDAELKFKKEMIKTVVLENIFDDLQRYSKTLEYAVTIYHKRQMEKINQFIREYWRKIYQGNDIDYIEIIADEMKTTECRRLYNYKLVQVKTGTVLDLRNRCSAGQKMLASLIIRMALAETFCSNCGILTLDEPTTNLDRRNIKNLARTLNEVLVTKQELTHTNFQLVVITHDEEFVKALMEVDAVDEVVRVARDLRGKTKVSQEVLNGTTPAAGQGNRRPQNLQFDYD